MAMAQKEHPDLIILDIGLPAGDGFVVLQRLQQVVALSCIPVIVLLRGTRSSTRNGRFKPAQSISFRSQREMRNCWMRRVVR